MEIDLKIPKKGKPKGKVYLVGAGPGSLDLLTVKAYKLLQKAEVVLYDALVSEDILEVINPKALKIFVGKRRGNHYKRQDEINHLLVKYAYDFSTVVRLKGGDPFIFGRGGEELLYLLERGVEVEIVPGVSSFYSAPELFGLPLTFRELARSFKVLTGHSIDEDICLEPQSGKETLVFLMGVHNRKKIAQVLLKKGWKPTTGVAFISNAYRGNGNLTLTTLGELAQNPPEVETPAVMVVGEVVNLYREKIRPKLQKVKNGSKIEV